MNDGKYEVSDECGHEPRGDDVFFHEWLVHVISCSAKRIFILSFLQYSGLEV